MNRLKNYLVSANTEILTLWARRDNITYFEKEYGQKSTREKKCFEQAYDRKG
jgi:hypothetical protein